MAIGNGMLLEFYGGDSGLGLGFTWIVHPLPTHEQEHIVGGIIKDWLDHTLQNFLKK